MTTPMDVPHEQHLQRIKDEFLTAVDKKYRAGQAEHGGSLWLKPGMLENAIEEAVDLVVYLLTMREQQAQQKASVYDVNQAEATLYQCSNCAREWYRTKAGSLDPTVCFECQNAEGR